MKNQIAIEYALISSVAVPVIALDDIGIKASHVPAWLMKAKFVKNSQRHDES